MFQFKQKYKDTWFWGLCLEWFLKWIPLVCNKWQVCISSNVGTADLCTQAWGYHCNSDIKDSQCSKSFLIPFGACLSLCGLLFLGKPTLSVQIPLCFKDSFSSCVWCRHEEARAERWTFSCVGILLWDGLSLSWKLAALSDLAGLWAAGTDLTPCPQCWGYR